MANAKAGCRSEAVRKAAFFVRVGRMEDMQSMTRKQFWLGLTSQCSIPIIGTALMSMCEYPDLNLALAMVSGLLAALLISVVFTVWSLNRKLRRTLGGDSTSLGPIWPHSILGMTWSVPAVWYLMAK